MSNLVCEAPAENVRVVRFLRPSLYDALYDHGHDYSNITDAPLFHEVRAAAVEGLPAGGVVVLNFGLVEEYRTAFQRVLVRLREEVEAGGGRLLLCAFAPFAREVFDKMQGPKMFEVHPTENAAVAVARGLRK